MSLIILQGFSLNAQKKGKGDKTKLFLNSNVLFYPKVKVTQLLILEIGIILITTFFVLLMLKIILGILL
jgi:hypothetical protein